MSWGFQNAGSQVTVGPELEEITTEVVGFKSIAGETKLRLLPQPWPTDALPPPTASLFSIASNKGLVAAAGPGSLVVATTDSTRQAYTGDAPTENNVKPFTPQATISIPRVSQVAFSSDESCLVIAAEQGGGLAVYDVQAILQGNKGPAFQMATNGIAVRALVPNPATDAAHFFAVVLSNGQLMVANLKERQFVNNGAPFREGVSCVSWSTRGKQLVAGLEDGTAVQYDPQGNAKDQIPKPPTAEGSLPLTSIYWLANDDFLVIHTPVNGDSQDSTYHMLHRDKASKAFTSRKFASDPCPAFGMPRNPANHFIERLKGFPPSLDDMLVLSSTAATDIGVFTRSSAPLSKDLPADQITNVYTMTSMANDANKAQMPMSVGDDMGDTSPIGMAVDLSSKELVKRPIPSEEMEETATPLPALMLLNNEGLLSTWWILYADSVKQKTAYPGLVTVAGSQQTAEIQSKPSESMTSSSSAPATTAAPQTPAFGGSAFGKPSQPAFGSSGFAKPAQPAFGSPSTPAFGGASALGAKPSPFAASPGTAQAGGSAFGKPAFGQPSFGQTSSFGSPSPLAGTSGNAAFGAAGGLGNKASPWGNSTATQQNGGSAFGKPSGVFGSAAPSGASGFAKFGGAGSSPFASAAGETKPTQSPFSSFGGNKSAASPFASFGQSSHKPSAFTSIGGSADKPSVFSAGTSNPAQMATGPSFGSTATLPSTTAGSFGAPSTIGTTSPWGTPSLQQQASTHSKEEDMTDETPAETPKPTALPSVSGFKIGSTFQGDGTAKDDLPQTGKAASSFFGGGFGSALGEAAKAPAAPPTPAVSAALAPETPIKKEPGTDEPNLAEISTTPASPPKPAARPVDDAPLPPDFTNPKFLKPASQDLSHIPGFGSAKKAPELASLPSATTAAKTDKPIGEGEEEEEEEEEDLPPIAGSPPVDLGRRSSSELSPPVSSEAGEAEHGEEEGPAEDSDDESWGDGSGAGEEEGEGDEGSDADAEEVDETEGESPEKTAPTPASNAFASRLTFPTSPNVSAQKASNPSTTPAGLPPAPFFAPPHVQHSPRSPSPIRSVSQTSTRPISRQAAQISVPPARPISRSISRPESSLGAPAAPAHPEAPSEPEQGDLEDDEDARIRTILESDIEPTRTLAPFIAHQDYSGDVTKQGLGGQIEKVYRDVNSMIDTLGLNARALEAFVRGHEDGYAEGGRERSDLETPEDWCLIEIEDLGLVGSSVGTELEEGRVQDVEGKVREIGSLGLETARLRNKSVEMRKLVNTRSDPESKRNTRNAPLNTEVQVQQSELRQTLMQVNKLLQELEEGLSVLRADLANAGGHDRTRSQPTVEAVTNTILKMTAMVEKKSGDVDVLEAQIRKLPRGLADLRLDDEEDLVQASRLLGMGTGSSSPYQTPPTSRGRGAVNGSASGLGMSGMLGRFGTPTRAAGLGGSMLGASMTSVGSVGASARKRRGIGDVTTEEVRAYNEKVERRRKVLGALRDTIERKGTRVVRVG